MPSTLGTVASQRGVSSPIPLAGLLGWYDAADGPSFDVATGAVAVWRDRSINGYTAIPPPGYANPAYEPVRTAAGVNGLPTAYCPDLNRVLQSSMPADSKPMTCVAVVAVEANASSSRTYLGIGSPGTLALDFGFETNNQPRIMVPGYARLALATDPVPNTPTLITWTYEATIGSWINYVNGVRNGSGSNNIALTAGRVSQIGSSNQYGGSGFQGHICEIIKYNRVLDASEQQQVETYLKTKWGTP